jgi:hypothetical protein
MLSESFIISNVNIMKHIYIDTNVFLHYNIFDQIDWLNIVNAESIVIVIPPITIRELNKQKELNPHIQVRNRAGDVLKKLSALFETKSTAHLRDNIELQLEDRDSTINFDLYQLKFEIQDDQLIASMIMFKIEKPKAEIVLVTSDHGLTLLAKARRHGISTAKMPDNLRILELPDESQKRITLLEQKLREMETKVPLLSLTFNSVDQHATFKLSQPLVLDRDEVKHKMEDIKRHYTKKEISKKRLESDHSSAYQGISALGSIMDSFNSLAESEITRYNSELEDFYKLYEKYLIDSIQSENFKRRTIEFLVTLTNDGTAPAEDIDIFMRFPDLFKLLEQRKLPIFHNAPEPPIEPRSQLQLITESTKISYPWLASLGPTVPAPPPPNISLPHIERGNNYYDYSIHVQKLKHNLQEQLRPLYIVFDSFENASSFHIDYCINAANIPHEKKGQLHIIIDK